jgi:hypothetical protein
MSDVIGDFQEPYGATLGPVIVFLLLGLLIGEKIATALKR